MEKSQSPPTLSCVNSQFASLQSTNRVSGKLVPANLQSAKLQLMKLQPENRPQYQSILLKEQPTKSEATSPPSIEKPAKSQYLKYSSSHSTSARLSELIVSDRTVNPFTVAARIPSNRHPLRATGSNSRDPFPESRVFGKFG